MNVEKSDLLIGGQMCPPESGQYYPLYSPVDGTLVAEVADACRADVEVEPSTNNSIPGASQTALRHGAMRGTGKGKIVIGFRSVQAKYRTVSSTPSHHIPYRIEGVSSNERFANCGPDYGG